MTVPLLPFVVRSRPWSKNWPNSVNQELYGAERPASGARLGMKRFPLVSSDPGVWAAAAAAAGLPIV